MGWTKWGLALAGLVAMGAATGSWAVGEEFVAAEPVTPNWSCNLTLTGAYLVDGDATHQYWLKGSCMASYKTGNTSVPLPFVVKEVAGSYDSKTKHTYEVVTITFKNKDYVFISNSSCSTDPYINKGVACTTQSKVNPFPLLGVTDADFPLARGMVSYSEAKAKSPKPDPLAIQVLTPNPNQQFSKGENVNIAAKVGKGYAQDGLKCCEVEVQQSIGGQWSTYKMVSEPDVGQPGGHNFAYDWFKQAVEKNSSSKFRLRLRAIKKAEYDMAPWSDFVEFWVLDPLDQPYTGPVGNPKISNEQIHLGGRKILAITPVVTVIKPLANSSYGPGSSVQFQAAVDTLPAGWVCCEAEGSNLVNGMWTDLPSVVWNDLIQGHTKNYADFSHLGSKRFRARAYRSDGSAQGAWSAWVPYTVQPRIKAPVNLPGKH